MTIALARPVRIGVQVAPQHVPYEAIRDTVAELEDLGVDIIFNWDHFFPLSGDPGGRHFEGWTMLAAWAEQTRRVQFGPLVSCNSYRNPDLLADMARTVDHISAQGGEGRLIFGIGSGWCERDYQEYGYEFGTVGSRLDDLAQALPRIRRRWQNLNPAPTRDIPVMIGGGGEKKTLRLVAEHADIWHSFSDVPTLEHKLTVLAQWCERFGRDPAAIEISTGASARDGIDNSFFTVIDQQYDLGARLFTLSIGGPNVDFAPVRELLSWRDGKNSTAP
ncbi:LLM class F420-dependent oxidoreductase [Rathayibacter toxicus]|uniref:5,10-methylene tetrahydromethanopterin reductase n=1 Tax=Rathayibacter toxicus TaxID=145458 RepID=A0A0C5BEW9_9MICO|nr:LLM class F420-dependent oxidoreductase [Rathayibacter toxicus]AJM77554.1 5,10-methylene tetrahydromethanopterin reductase [Rathayibacter toxicus]ALS56523.1 LLM class F420-dependent oxidoreductase [Rathayibacter toxicus]KKM44621.1 5,10-methylene tetrahydromethanopterin reductase [Rathayibacter toxicus]PPG21651.1 LLM class F420-dependent oxidoreductase [Rathayibacter toxicus]PPG46613.1 LLM class F420-dependent oxidoreductase [Rathayibacter toxicus]